MAFFTSMDGEYFTIHVLAIFCADLFKESMLTSHSMCGTTGVKRLRSTKALYNIKVHRIGRYSFKHNVGHPDTFIASHFDTCKAANIEHNRRILKSLPSAVLFCGKQCTAFRVDIEKHVTPGNPGNFLALLKLLATNDDTLRKHLDKAAIKNATCISPQSQNDLIKVIGDQIF